MPKEAITADDDCKECNGTGIRIDDSRKVCECIVSQMRVITVQGETDGKE